MLLCWRYRAEASRLRLRSPKLLDAELDIFLVRKLGMPGHREYAIGAIASGGVRVLSEDVVRTYRVPAEAIEAVAREEQTELERREREYRQGAPLTNLRDRDRHPR